MMGNKSKKNQPIGLADRGTCGSKHASRATERIFIDRCWFIPVDRRGYCAGRYYEGAFGCVIQLENADRDDHSFKLALKIPRFLADTDRENAYVDWVAEIEASTVYHVALTPEVSKQGLLKVGPVAPDILQNPQPLRASKHEDAQAQDGHIVLARFEKGNPPRFVSTKRSRKGAIEWRPRLEAGERPSDRDVRAAIESMYGKTPPRSTVVFSVQNNGHKQPDENAEDERSKTNSVRDISVLQKSLVATDDSHNWYAAMPTIVYEWSPATLQQTISNDERGDKWQFDDHLRLLGQVLDGVHALHSLGFLHGDIRPANIMCAGDRTVPGNYVVGDYGSFCFDGESRSDNTKTGLALARDDSTFGTLVGPQVGTERHSPFYSSERRVGAENESADTALVLRRGADIAIRLGWKSELLDESGTAKEECIRELRDFDADGAEADLRKGDRIRLRDYIFVVENSYYVKKHKVLICEKRAWRTIHDRLVIPENETNGDSSFEEATALSIPAVIELKRWSASTDLFGIGALGLYSVFRSPTGTRIDDQEARSADDRFAEMIKTLESKAYFATAWKPLEELCTGLEDLTQRAAEGEEGKQHARRELYGSSEEKDESLLARAKREISNISRATPGIKTVLKALDFNLAHFLLLLNFTLRCLHTEANLPTQNDDGGVDENDTSRLTVTPFCEDRFEAASREGPVAHAKETLDYIESLATKEILEEFRCEDHDIWGYSPTQPLAQTRAQRELEDKNKQLEKWNGDLSDVGKQLEREKKEALRELERTKRNLSLLADHVSKSRFGRRSPEVKSLIAELKEVADRPYTAQRATSTNHQPKQEERSTTGDK